MLGTNNGTSSPDEATDSAKKNSQNTAILTNYEILMSKDPIIFANFALDEIVEALSEIKEFEPYFTKVLDRDGKWLKLPYQYNICQVFSDSGELQDIGLTMKKSDGVIHFFGHEYIEYFIGVYMPGEQKTRRYIDLENIKNCKREKKKKSSMSIPAVTDAPIL